MTPFVDEVETIDIQHEINEKQNYKLTSCNVVGLSSYIFVGSSSIRYER